jgi:zinc transport system substrate-binding protein
MRRPLLAALLLSAAPAWAEVPRVLADTAPVHSLVAMVMGDLGSPELIVPPGTSPHDASLSPSEARRLTEANLIVWTGDAFLPWMGESIASLAPDTPALALLEAEGWEPLPLRAGAHLGGHDHDHDEGHEHDEQEHGEHEHEHGDEQADHEHEAGAAVDPHAWLDPAVAASWLGLIGDALAEADPGNAETYRANAQAASARVGAMGEDLRARLSPLGGTGYAVGHDAYQYLERAMGLPANWAVRDASGAEPAPRDVAGLRDAVAAGEVGCLLLDAETDPTWAETLAEGAALRTATVDPDGVFLAPGPDLYPQLMEALAAALEGCLKPA